LNISVPLDFSETQRLVSQFFIISAFVGSSAKNKAPIITTGITRDKIPRPLNMRLKYLRI
jgi:hypothetical protein